ncbi:MAG: hypothetical protein GY708_12180 [Actinomycetia bacterium]|nr:hypothetical protein [Actinomycetes bacterium]MCP4958363.1 hypothetical protein [Actinomycetes bacterium]
MTETDPTTRARSRVWRAAYLSAMLILTLIVGSSTLDTVAGGSVAGWFGRNSEAWVLALLIPLQWELFASRFDPHVPVAGAEARFRSRLPVAIWLLAMLAATIVLQTDSFASTVGMPSRFVTWGEAFLATAVVTLYLAWSRGYLGSREPNGIGHRGGAPTKGAKERLLFYLVLVLYALVAYSDLEVGWLRQNAEAHAAMLIIPLWFDVVAPHRWVRSLVVHVAWYTFLIAVPLIASSEVFERGVFVGSAFESASIWLGRTTEAYLAGALISTYFWVWRRGGP